MNEQVSDARLIDPLGLEYTGICPGSLVWKLPRPG